MRDRRATLLILCLVFGPSALVGQEDSHRVALDVGVLAATVSYAHAISDRARVGLAVGGGGQLGWTLGSGTITTGDRSAPAMFLEILQGSLFFRRGSGAWQLEPGFRASWNYHARTEFESRFYGPYLAVFRRLGCCDVGARLQLGRWSEEAGRSETQLGVVPLLLRWPGRR